MPGAVPCGGKVGAEGSIDLYQVDIPPIQPETWKFVVGHGHCQECGRRVRGQHPLLISKAFEVGTVHFGPRLLAFAAFQKMICGVSYDKIRLGFEQMLGFPVARSTLCRAMQRLARRAKPTRDALVEALRASPVVYADETGWKQGGRRVWLWVFTNLRETVYEILPGRGFEQAASVLGKNYAGILGVDGWAPYRCFKEATLQTCYNHLLHRCHELLETATRGAVRFPRLVKAILRHALALRDRRDAGEISPHGLRVAKGLLQAKMNRLLHGRFTNPANQRFAKHLRRYRDNSPIAPGIVPECSGASRVKRAARAGFAALDAPCALWYSMLVGERERSGAPGIRVFMFTPNDSFAEPLNLPFCLLRPGSTLRRKKQRTRRLKQRLARGGPYLRGSMTSRITRSKVRDIAKSSPSGPSAVRVATWPSFSRPRFRRDAMRSSSSTIRISTRSSLGENSEGMLKPRTQRPATSSQWVRRFTHRNAT